MSAKLYSYRVFWSEEDQEFVGVCSEMPSLSHLADSPEGALAGIRQLVEAVIEDLRANGEAVPQPLSERKFTGDLRVRLPPNLHRRLATEAQESSRSLNRVIIDHLVASDVTLVSRSLQKKLSGPRPAAKAFSAKAPGRRRVKTA